MCTIVHMQGNQTNGDVIADAVRFAPISVPTSSAHYCVHTDHLNTPRLVADSAGATVWRWDQQEPFGVNVPDENPAGLGAFEFPLRFPGQYADVETTLHYSYLRDCYDSVTGRFCQPDPLGLNGGDLSLYVYSKNSPTMYSDPLGLQSFSAFGQGGAGAGVQALLFGLNFNCGAAFSTGLQRCAYCTVCVRLGPGLYVGGGAVVGGGVVSGNTSAIGGYSVGAGFDLGFGGSVGGSAAVGVTGNPFQGPVGSPTSFGVAKGRAGGGFGVGGGLELCKTELVCRGGCSDK